MFKNYFKTAWRNLRKNKASSFINIGGLAVGMAVALLISLWVWDELSFNTYHQNYNRIAQVMKLATYDGEKEVGKNLPYPLTIQLKNNYKNYFKYLVTARQEEDFDLAAGEKKITQTGQFIDAAAPEMLSLEMLKGSRAGLQELHSILLSASAAKILFGNEDPIGKAVTLNNNIPVKVTGVYKDIPLNSAFHNVQFFSPFDLDVASNSWVKEQSWDNQFLIMYAEIMPGFDFKTVSSAIKDAELGITKNLSQYKKQADRKPQVFLNPMSQWHLYSEFKGGIRQSGPLQFVWLIGIIGAFVLLLACINFMNLSTARSEKRAREVGVRKTMGSRRFQLIIQFFSESFLVVLLAFVVSLFLVSFSLSWFNELAAKQVILPLNNYWFWLFTIVFICVTSLLAGSYPALYLSSFQPVKVLKSAYRAGRFAALPRKILVVVQFTVSAALIICTLIIYNQVMYVKNRPVGYTREGLLMIQKKSGDFYGKDDLLRAELKKTGAVTEMAQSGGEVTNVWQWNGGFEWKGKDASLDPHFGTLAVSAEYGKTVGWQFIEGKDFSENLSDSAAVVINESAARIMGLKEPVGEYIRWETEWRKARYYRIAGVVKDMVMESPFDPIVPTIFRMEADLGWFNIKIDPSISSSEALSKIEAVFKKFIPSAAFDYRFADEEYALKFAAEERVGKLAGFFAILAVFISCMGLFGLASFVAEQRIKEIGVRKVLGASVFNLWNLLSKEFVLLVAISFIIAAPLSYYFMHGWLQNYQYRTQIDWPVFVLAGAGALAVTLLTVSYQSIKAAIANPVKSLKTE